MTAEQRRIDFLAAVDLQDWKQRFIEGDEKAQAFRVDWLGDDVSPAAKAQLQDDWDTFTGFITRHAITPANFVALVDFLIAQDKRITALESMLMPVGAGGRVQ